MRQTSFLALALLVATFSGARASGPAPATSVSTFFDETRPRAATVMRAVGNSYSETMSADEFIQKLYGAFVFHGTVLSVESKCEGRGRGTFAFPDSRAILSVRIVREFRGHVNSDVVSILVHRVSNPDCVSYENQDGPESIAPGDDYLFVCSLSQSGVLATNSTRLFCMSGESVSRCKPNERFDFVDGGAVMRDYFTSIAIDRQVADCDLIAEIEVTASPSGTPQVSVTRVLRGTFVGSAMEISAVPGAPIDRNASVTIPPGRYVGFFELKERGWQLLRGLDSLFPQGLEIEMLDSDGHAATLDAHLRNLGVTR